MKRSLFALLFAAMIAVAQQQSPQPKPRAQKATKPIGSLFQQFRYRVAYADQGSYLAGFSEVHASSNNSGPSGQSPRRLPPGMNKNVNITFKRGVVTQDPSFAEWVNRSRAPSQVKDLVIDTFDESGQKSSTLHLSRCVVTEYHSVPDLEGRANSATIQAMTLHCAAMKRSTR